MRCLEADRVQNALEVRRNRDSVTGLNKLPPDILQQTYIGTANKIFTMISLQTKDKRKLE